MNGFKNNEFVEASYGELLQAFQPHTIRSEKEFQRIQSIVDNLIDKGDLSEAEEEILDLLGELIWAYEAHTEDKSQYALSGVPLIKGLMEDMGLQQKDLVPIFKTKSIVSAVLSGKRRLTVDQIDGLSAFFRLPQSLFFEPSYRTTAGHPAD